LLEPSPQPFQLAAAHRAFFGNPIGALGEDVKLAVLRRQLDPGLRRGSGRASDRAKLRRARRRESRYLLRTNLTDDDPARLWGLYLQLVSVEEAFRNLKGDLAIRPIFHQDETRIEAHIFIAFLAYCLHVTLARLHALAPGLTPRNVIEKFAAVQMIDLHVPTTDGRELMLTRYTEPEPELALLLDKLKFVLPAQPEPKISAARIAPSSPA
jgi:hypothetical protein